MSITQRYWLVLRPWLIVFGVFFGMFGLAAIFILTYPAYYGHRKGWGGGKFAVAATLLTLALFFLATSRPV